MNRQEAIDYMRQNAGKVLERDKSGKGYICPFCGSGGGSNGTGMTTRDNIHFRCWGCDSVRNLDIIDILALQHGVTDFNAKVDNACDIFGISIDSFMPVKKIQQSSPKQTADTTADSPPADYREYFKECAAHIGDTDYWQKRGLSRDVVERFLVGYDPEWRHPNASQSVPTSPRLIIPTGNGSYLARDTRTDLTVTERRYEKVKVGSPQCFNLKALKTADKPIFIVEGEIDAMAIMTAGGEAVGLGGTTNTRPLLRAVESQKPAQPLILALDNDDAGRDASERLGRELQRMGISFYRLNPYGESKDAAAALVTTPDEFHAAITAAANIEQETRAAEVEEYRRSSAAGYVSSFIDGIRESVNTPRFSTGFKQLDEALGGGLYEGLYVLGAISSLGKTALIMQIADQIAQNGNDVCIFSLEMARSELMARSIARETFKKAHSSGDIRNAKTARGILDGARYANYNDAEHELIRDAIRSYSEYAPHIFIIEGMGDVGTSQIREAVDKHISFTGRRPVCVVDYLQLLVPHTDRMMTEKQTVDYNVLELKRISRDFKLPMIAVSSFNRQSYDSPVRMDSFKESGAVEYSSDVLLGLQLEGAGRKDFDATIAKSKDPREVQCVVLKNRNGRVGVTVGFEYSPAFNHFVDSYIEGA